MSALQEEEIIKRSPRGKKVREILHYLEKHCDRPIFTEIAVTVITKLQSCIDSGNKYKLPSISQGCMWNAFHKLRNSDDMKRVWSTFVAAMEVPQPCCTESQLAMQLMMDRVLKKMIEKRANAMEHLCTHRNALAPLTMRERSAIRYMAGFVAIKLLKRYREPSKHEQVKFKRQLFVQVLKRMSAADQSDTVDSVDDYTRLWSELIDRGGLYHINDEVCTTSFTIINIVDTVSSLCYYCSQLKVLELMEAVETVVRCHLNAQKMHTYKQGSDLLTEIVSATLTTSSVLSSWERIAQTIPPTYEQYSIELLKNVISLWVTVRAHAFAKGWTMKFESKYQKGTRKSLQCNRKVN